jgi:hypothetical protein
MPRIEPPTFETVGWRVRNSAMLVKWFALYILHIAEVHFSGFPVINNGKLI